MSATGVTIGKGASIEVGRGEPIVFTKLAGIGDVGFPEQAVDEIDVTHQDSDDGAKEFIAGLTDNGEVSVNLHWVPESPTDILLQAIRASRETVQLKFSAPGMAAPEIYAGFCKGYARTAPVGEAMMATVMFRISGRVE